MILKKQFSSKTLIKRTLIHFFIDWSFLAFMCFGIFSIWNFFDWISLGWQSFFFGGVFAIAKLIIMNIVYSFKDNNFINAILSENQLIYTQKIKTASYFIKEFFYCWLAFGMLLFGDLSNSQKNTSHNICLAILFSGLISFGLFGGNYLLTNRWRKL